MINQKVNFENPETEIKCEFGEAIRELQISKLLTKSNIKGKSGKSFYEVFQFLLLLVFQNCNLYHFLNSKKKDTAFSKNTYYRFLNNASFNWVKFISLLATRVTAYFDRLTRPERVTCLVLDDSVIARERSKKVELLSYVFNHVIGKTVKGFNLLTLGWTDGYSFIPVGFNMMASAKASNRIAPANASIDKRSNGGKARKNAVLQKPEAAMKLIRNALNAGIKARYVLMDTWFTNEPFIANILAEGLDVIGMLKDNKQYYIYNGKKYNLKQLGKLVSFSKPGDILYSICAKTGKQNIDKTGLIRDLLNNWGEVNLFTRPRRFGKTLNMSMLKNFFEIGANKSLFDGLAISQETALCEKYMGKYPVIYISLKGVDGLNFEEACGALRRIIRAEASRFNMLFNSEKIADDDKQLLLRILQEKDTADDIRDSLRMLSSLLYQYYNEKVILLIDEYDVPLDKAFQHNYYREMVPLIRGLFGQVLKTNEFLKFAVLT